MQQNKTAADVTWSDNVSKEGCIVTDLFQLAQHGRFSTQSFFIDSRPAMSTQIGKLFVFLTTSSHKLVI